MKSRDETKGGEPIPLASAPANAERYRVRDLLLDVNAGIVKRGPDTLALSPLSFGLLVALIRRAPQPVPRQELMATVWPNEFVNDDAVWQRVRLLREALGDFADEPRYITSVRGWGYRLVPEVERIKDTAPPIRALAVLPLANLSGDPQQEYFADGMTETLIAQLAKIRALKVISRTSVMYYKHAERPLPEIARELGVDAVIEGSSLAAGGKVRVSVQLIRAATDEHLWAEVYDRDLEDVLALHADLARAIATEIRILISPEERLRLEPRRRVDPAAHDAGLRGRFFLAKYTPHDLDRAIGYFEQAVALDPSFAEAFAGLAQACFFRGTALSPDLNVPRQRELLTHGKQAALHALAIDGAAAEAHAALAMILLFLDWDWQGAGREVESALEVDSNSALAHAFGATLGATYGDAARTLGEMRRAIELDPLNLSIRAEAAECCFWVRDFEQAARYASEALDLDASYPRAHFVLGRIREAEGRLGEAIAEYETAGLITDGAGARRALEEGGRDGYYRWFGTGTAPNDRPFFEARMHVRLGEFDEAMGCFEQAYEDRECLLVLLKALDFCDVLRNDPRFADLVRRIGIP